jgi:hypothetical protein
MAQYCRPILRENIILYIISPGKAQNSKLQVLFLHNVYHFFYYYYYLAALEFELRASRARQAFSLLVPLRQPFCDGFFKIDLGNYLTKADFEP